MISVPSWNLPNLATFLHPPCISLWISPPSCLLEKHHPLCHTEHRDFCLFSSYLYWFYSHSFSLFLVNLSVCDWYLSSLPYKYITKMEVFYCFWGMKVLFHLYFDAFLLCVWGVFLLEIHQLYFSNCTLALDSLPPISINTAENTSNN